MASHDGQTKTNIENTGAESVKDEVTEFRVVLVGKIGMGKSALGNSLLRTPVFNSSSSLISVTTEATLNTCELTMSDKKITLKVCDTPGMFDASLPTADIMNLILKCVTHTDPGPHVFLFVMKLDRISQESLETIKHFKANFGVEVLRFTRIIFTGRDLIEESLENALKPALEQMPEFNTFIEKCDKYESINNRGSEEEIKQDVDRILHLISLTIRKNNCEFYTNKMCEEAKQFYQKKQKEEEKQKKEELRREIKLELRDEIESELREEKGKSLGEFLDLLPPELKRQVESALQTDLSQTSKDTHQQEYKPASSRGSSSAETGVVKSMTTRAYQAKQSPSSSTGTKSQVITMTAGDVKTGEEDKKMEAEKKKEEKELESNRTSNITDVDNANKDQADPTAGRRERERGPIKEPDRTILREKIPSLLKMLNDPKLLIPSLIARSVFDDDDKEKVEREIRDNGKKAGMTELLNILLDCGSDALQLFMECLKDNNCKPALKLLQSAISEERTGKAEKRIKNKTKEKNEEERKNEEKDDVKTGEGEKKIEKKKKEEKVDVKIGEEEKNEEEKREENKDNRGRVRGPMNEPDRTTLKKNIPKLSELITEPDKILESLCARDVFDGTDREKVKRQTREKGNRAGVTELLNLLLDCGKDALQLFGECLKENNYDEALKLLGIDSDAKTGEEEKKIEKKKEETELKQNQSAGVVDTAEGPLAADGEPVCKKPILSDVPQAPSRGSSSVATVVAKPMSTKEKPRKSQVVTETNSADEEVFQGEDRLMEEQYGHRQISMENTSSRGSSCAETGVVKSMIRAYQAKQSPSSSTGTKPRKSQVATMTTDDVKTGEGETNIEKMKKEEEDVKTGEKKEEKNEEETKKKEKTGILQKLRYKNKKTQEKKEEAKASVGTKKEEKGSSLWQKFRYKNTKTQEKKEEAKELEPNRLSNITDVYNANKDQTDPTPDEGKSDVGCDRELISPLHEESLNCKDMKKYKTVVDKYIQYINTTDGLGWTPLLKACISKYHPIEKLILLQQSGADIKITKNNNALHIACLLGSLDSVKYLIEELQFNIETPGYYDRTPLHRSSCSEVSPVEKMKYLISKGVNVETVDSQNNNALHLACSIGSLDTVKYLIEELEFNIETPGYSGQTPVLASSQSKISPVEKMKYLISKGVNVETVDNNNDNVLHLACRLGSLDTVKYITE